MQMTSAGASHVGRVRRTNEDAYLLLGRVAVVADGMGGHACGDVASALTVAAFTDLPDSGITPQAVLDSVGRANQAILDETARHPDRRGMGTTVAGVALVEQAGSPHWLVFNVGDSRVYRLTPDTAVQLTVDHSEVSELVAAGRLTPQGAKTHPLRNVVTRSLGSTPAPTPDTWLFPVGDGDVFLICSDGLTGELRDDEIVRIVDAAPDLGAGAAALVEAAIAAGGRDNVTAVLVGVAGRTGVSYDEADTTTLPRVDVARRSAGGSR